ncbi:MAG: hypothetical protein K6G85_05970 [Eubacterium sp.]|nr:hypothetical protein [Eubacterium sp.]
MRLSKLVTKKSLLRKISSVSLAAVMVANMVLANLYLPAEKTTKVDAATITPQYRNVMYYGEWSIYAGQKNYTPDKIPGNYITHLNFAFMDVDENGNVISTDTWADFQNPNVGFSATSDSPWAGVAPAMIQLRDMYPNMKIGFSVGGWTRSGDFPKVAASSAKRKAFAENIAKAAHLYGYDFVDIDWEYPTADRDSDPTGNGVNVDKGCKGSPADKQNFTYLMQDLREALDRYGAMDNKHYELSVAMSASPTMMAQIEYDKVLNIVDFANMMTYDLSGAWNAYTGHQTALFTNESYNHQTQLDGQFSVDACVKYLYNTYGNKIDASKIVVGVAPYTRGWAGVKNDGPDSNNPGLYATAEPNSVKAADGTTSGTFAFSDIGSLVSQYGLQEYYDETAQAAYYYSPSSGYFFTCDNARSVTAKADYVKNTRFKNPFNKPLGGLISWMASLDAASTITKTTHDALFGANNQLAAQKIEFPSIPNLNASVTTSGNDYKITITNNNRVTTPEKQGTFNAAAEANVLYYAEKFAGSVTYPKLYIKMKDGSTLTGSSWAAGGTIGNSNGYTTVSMTAWPYYLGTADSQSNTWECTLTSSKAADVSNISEIAITKSAKSGGNEVAWTNLLGNGTAPDPTTQAQATTKAPDTTKAQATTQAPATTKTQSTTSAQETTKPASTGNYPEWSSNDVAYALGNLVQYRGKVYECTYQHRSNTAWSPVDAPTLWKERTDLVAGENQTTGGNGEQPTEDNYTVNGILPQHTVTGYWHNFDNNSVNLKLADVPTYYDLICVAFTGNTSTPGEATFSIDKDLKEKLGYSEEEFIQDIKTLKARNQHVIISVGGAEGRITINSDAAANKFAESMKSIIRTYGFEGIDIDLEGMAVSGTNYIASALRSLRNEFGENFIITMAPETAYMIPGSGGINSAYWNLAISIKDILTTVHTQFYNSGGMNGYNGSVVNPGTGAFPANLSTLYIESGLRPDQVAIGVPSSSSAAGSGQITPQQAANAFNAMINGTTVDGFTPPKAYPTFRGLMTWSINWDAKQNYAWAKAARAAVDAAPTVEVPTNNQNPTTKAEETTKVTEQTTSSSTSDPIVPFGVVATSPRNNVINVVWGNSSELIALGETFNIYVDGKKVMSGVGCASHDITNIAAGTHTVTVTGVVGNKESAGTSVRVTVNGTTEVSTEAPTQEPTTGKTVAPSGKGPVLIGYYHTWDNSGNPFIKLRDVDDDWDIINISFSEPVQAGSTDGRMKFDMSGVFNSSYTKEDFKADIKAKQAQGKKIVLSIGGYLGYFSLDSQAAINQFVSDIKGFVNEYGFDGIDIDLEQSSVNFDQGNDQDIRTINSPRLKNMTTAIRTICESYGDDFILSWAPETFYVQLGYMYYAGINTYCDKRAGSYLPMINALRDITDYVHVQLYNSQAMTAPDGKTYTMGTKEGVVAMCKMLLEGFHVGEGTQVPATEKTWFAPLRPDQVVIGVPSSAGAAGSGQISNANLQAAFTELNNQYPGMGGIMTWSINWDSSQNNNSFANENGAFLSQFKTVTPEPSTEEPTTSTVEEGGVEINGYQVSNTVGGMRTVYTVSNKINGKNVVEKGMVYGIGTYTNESEMYVGNTSRYVASFAANGDGVLTKNYSKTLTSATSYAMTMKFAVGNAKEFTTKWYVRAYAKLSDGSIVYSDVENYTIYNIANILYQRVMMPNPAGHQYLYNNILTKVNPDYKAVDYDWASTIVK